MRGDGNYVYRRIIPPDYRILANGKREFKESLRTKKHTDAITRYGETHGKYEAIFDQLKTRIALTDQPRLKSLRKERHSLLQIQFP
ncbi:DUF6538 domain-containing protein [Mesorhizobium intechi]|uniref:DUF6538 domain-containing protein n=1 Tax=Mesorhizobium intechi TaxID=537601 RepID=UPI003CCC6B8C